MTYRWYAIRSNPRSEDFLADQMQTRRIDFFNPQIRVQPVNPRAKKIKPYFPGYLFVRLDLEKMPASSMQNIPGAAGLVTFGGEAADVPDSLIRAIQQRIDGINNAQGEFLDAVRSGEPVVIASGSFAGYEAIFDARLPGSDRVRVLLQLLNDRQVLVDLLSGQIRPKK